MNKHTPGPWIANIDHNRGKLYILSTETFRSGIDGKDHPQVIAQAFKKSADARLIAAAPDMLEALYMVRKYLKGENMGSCILSRIEKVIAKAENE